MTKLDLYNNRLTSLPVEFGKLTCLSDLSLTANKFTILPLCICQLQNLTVLRMDYNQLNSLPPEIVKIKTIKRLDVDGNQLNNLPPEIGKLINLNGLNIARNQIEKIPAEIGELQKLIYFNCRGNSLTKFPPEIKKMTNLRRLIINREILMSLPSEVRRLHDLTIVVNGVLLTKKYRECHPSRWRAEWLLSEKNAEVRRLLIQEIGYGRICQELQAKELDRWREYQLLSIDADVDVEQIYLLKMTCPSTSYIHALRVPPDVESAREAIKWVNWGVDPDEFSVQS